VSWRRRSIDRATSPGSAGRGASRLAPLDWPLVGWGVVVATIAVERVRSFAAAPPTDFDDAYMFLRYANNLIAGRGLVWNPGEGRVNGVTGLVHLGAVTLLRALLGSWSDGAVLRAASAGAGAVAIALLAVACARLHTPPYGHHTPPYGNHTPPYGHHTPPYGRTLLWAAAIAPLVAYSEPFAFHCLSGMDTLSSLAAVALVLLATVRLWQQPTRARAAACALAGWVAILARPDNAVVAFGCPLLAIALVCRRPRLALAFLPLLALLVGAQLAIARALLGTALPLSFWVKRPFAYGGFVGEYTWNPFLFLEVFGRAAVPFVIVLVVAAKRRHAMKLIALLLPSLITIASLFAINQIMGHLGRFYFPQLAAFVIAAALVLEGVRSTSAGTAIARGVLAIALLIGGAEALEAAGRVYERRAETQPLARLDGWAIDARAPLPDADSWQSSIEVAAIAAAAPRGARLAMSEHGLVGARAPDAVIIDVIGLHDRVFARGFDAAELWRRRPDAIWLPHPDYTQMIRAILDSDEFWRDFVFYPDALSYGIAVRRDARELRALVEERLRADHPGVRLDEHVARRASPRPPATLP
jgi:hypothetical protein